MACQTRSLANFCLEGTKTSPSSQRIAGTQAAMALWEPGAQLPQVERERQRHSQKGELTRPWSHRKSMVELEQERRFMSISCSPVVLLLKEREQPRAPPPPAPHTHPQLLKLSHGWSSGSQVGA